MNILLVFAHPESRSLNGSLRDFTVRKLELLGHQVQVSDLYAMRWKAVLDGADFPACDPRARFDPIADSHRAFVDGTQSTDVAAEQQKLLWAHAVILQFPLWWFSLPAILKGWVDRVYAHGFGYGVGEHSDRRWGDRYGEGTLAGKRAMLIVTTGGWEEHYSERGVNGPMDDLLFPINHGILHYPGFDVLPPFVVYRAEKTTDERYAKITAALGRRLEGLFTDEPIPYRRQNGGDYEIPALTLKPGREEPNQHGLRLHVHTQSNMKTAQPHPETVRPQEDRRTRFASLLVPIPLGRRSNDGRATPKRGNDRDAGGHQTRPRACHEPRR